MKKRNIYLILLIAFLRVHSGAQVKRAAHWYFGYEAGVDFSTGIAIVDTTAACISIEGSASISDTLGNLLFYSNGQKVWNKNGLLMPNSSGLIGDESAAQSCIILPKPESDSIFYLFNTLQTNQSGLYYNVIDMALNNGLGDVTASKNVQLHPAGTEELAATFHCNQKDYWIVARQQASNLLKFFAYRLSSSGISTAVVSQFTVMSSLTNNVGGLTFSRDATKLAFNATDLNKVYLFSFNNQTGQIALNQSIDLYQGESVYSNAFSANGNFLYITSWNNMNYCRLSKFDLGANNISSSRIELDSVNFTLGSPNGYGFIGQLRLAPDQKIYVSRWHQKYPYQINPNTYYSLDSLGVINGPDLSGLACNYQRNGFYLKKRPTQLGLPNFASHFVAAPTSFPDCLVTGQNEEEGQARLKVYPNPAGNRIHIEVFSGQRYNAELYDLTGVCISRKKIADYDTLDLSAISRGLYILKISSKNETTIFKIVKE